MEGCFYSPQEVNILEVILEVIQQDSLNKAGMCEKVQFDLLVFIM